jgi:hypothetical protein
MNDDEEESSDIGGVVASQEESSDIGGVVANVEADIVVHQPKRKGRPPHNFTGTSQIFLVVGSSLGFGQELLQRMPHDGVKDDALEIAKAFGPTSAGCFRLYGIGACRWCFSGIDAESQSGQRLQHLSALDRLESGTDFFGFVYWIVESMYDWVELEPPELTDASSPQHIISALADALFCKSGSCLDTYKVQSIVESLRQDCSGGINIVFLHPAVASLVGTLQITVLHSVAVTRRTRRKCLLEGAPSSS